MAMTEVRKLTVAWGALIATATLIFALLGGFGGAVRAMALWEGRVRALEVCSAEAKAEIAVARNHRAILSQNFGEKLASLDTNVGLLRIEVREIKENNRQTANEIKAEIRQRR